MNSANVDFGFLRQVVMSQSGNLVDPSRDYLFESRLQGVLHTRGLHSLGELVTALRSDRGELQRSVVEAMMINETSFFRDAPTFELLRTELLPNLIARRKDERRLRFWSAASSSGQEAYSLAMLIRENFPEPSEWKIEIVGSDISHEMVERSRAGRYQRIEVNRGLPARLLIKYLTRRGDEWKFKPEIREMCQFQQRNLLSVPTAGWRFDCIFLRNVMIYFPEERRREVLMNVHRSLRPDGALILGLSEQPRLDSHWKTELRSNAVWYRPI
jgi:chemotaxis protein methyltransferase CheR